MLMTECVPLSDAVYTRSWRWSRHRCGGSSVERCGQRMLRCVVAVVILLVTQDRLRVDCRCPLSALTRKIYDVLTVYW